MQPVHPALERDGELDEVRGRRSLERELRPARTSRRRAPPRERDGERQRGSPHAAIATPSDQAHEGSSEKKTGYAACCFRCSSHPGRTFSRPGRARPPQTGSRVEVRERDDLRLALVDHVDSAVLHERRRLGGAHVSVTLTSTSRSSRRVLERDLEGEVAATCRSSSRWSSTAGLRGPQTFVYASALPWIPVRSRRWTHRAPAADSAHRTHGVEVGVLDEDGRGRRHIVHALCRHGLGRGALEQLLPHDVARLEPLCLSASCCPAAVASSLSFVANVSGAPEPADAELQRLDRARVRGVSGPGASTLRARDVELLLLQEAAELVSSPTARVRESQVRREIAPDLLRVRPTAPMSPCSSRTRLRVVAGAPLTQTDEQPTTTRWRTRRNRRAASSGGSPAAAGTAVGGGLCRARRWTARRRGHRGRSAEQLARLVVEEVEVEVSSSCTVTCSRARRRPERPPASDDADESTDSSAAKDDQSPWQGTETVPRCAPPAPSSSSTATGRCGRSAAAARARSGLRATSRRASTSR